jgi:hypothetical protein
LEVVENNAAGDSIRDYVHVTAACRFFQVGKGCACAVTVFDIHVETAKAFLLPSVHINSERKSSFATGLKKGFV